MELNEKLYELRKNNNWSQEELAEKLDVSRQTISKWESSKAIPELDKLVKISEIYNITLDELVKGTTRNETTDTLTKKWFRKYFKKILIILAILLVIFIVGFVINILRRISVVTDISKYYKENFQTIGITKSGCITENITKRDLNNIEETHKQYFYYVSETGEKLVKIIFYKDINLDTPLKEVYIDLTKENENGFYDNVTEIDKLNGTRKVINDYEFDSPIYKSTNSLNNYYSLICAGDKVFFDKEMAFDFNNKVAKIEEAYVWNNQKINNSKDNIYMLFNQKQFYLGFDNYQEDIKETREIINIRMDTTIIPNKDEVTVPEV